MAAHRNLALFRRMDDAELSLCLLCNRVCGRQTVQQFFVMVSRLGDGLIWYLLLLLLPLVYGVDGWYTNLRLVTVGVVGVAVYKLLKTKLVRQRPYIRHRRIHRGTMPLDAYSFPSGHTLHAVAFSGTACWWHPELGWVLAPFTAAVAASRVALGLHYPSDVLAGAVLGLALAASIGCA